MYAVVKASVVCVAVSVAVGCPLPAAAADLGGPSLKDNGWSAPVRPVAGPCYWRADVGHSWSQNTTGQYAGNPDPDLSGEDLGNGWFGEIGAGCGSGSLGWRADVTLGLRQAIDFGGDVVLPGPATSHLTADVRTYTLMLNGYYDLGNFNGMVPYVGAGVGVAYHRMSDVQGDVGPTSQSGGDNTAFAWSLMAGVAYQLTERAILDIGYRFIDLGSVRSGSDPVLARLEIDDMRAHEIKIGLRYHFGSSASAWK
jgi:opacity protein-like surface antigen